MTATEKHKPMSTLPKSNELDEYTKSIRNYLASHGDSRARSPEFCWKDLPSVRSSQKPVSDVKTTQKSPTASSKTSSSKKYYEA
jgi:hypothetical protein